MDKNNKENETSLDEKNEGKQENNINENGDKLEIKEDNEILEDSERLDIQGDTDKDKDENKKQKVNNKKYFILGAIIGIIIVFFIVINTTTNKYTELVYPGIKIYDEDLSKLNKNDLKNKLKDISENISSKNIHVNTSKSSYSIIMKDIIDDYNLENAYEEIINTYKNENKFNQFLNILLKKDKEYKFKVKLNEKNIDNFIKNIEKENNKNCIEPKVIIENEKISYKDGINGKVIDKKSTISLIKNSIGTKESNIEVKYKEEKPSININTLKKVNSKISSYTTTYGAGGGRAKNVELAAKKIDDFILMPGDEFSYEKALGDITLENGFFYAPVISNGELKNGVGGGVCQVSSTLYNTQLKAGILPTERRNHSKAVSYVPRGLDATLATGSIDYKFKNTYDYPIVINTIATNGKLTIEFWSNEDALKGITYEARGYASGNTANTYLYGYDKDGKKIYEKHIDTSIYR